MTEETSKEYEGTGLPESLRVKRPYTMSKAALKARRENAQKSTGPTSDDGKAASSRNAWKHGLYAQTFFGTLGKPCQSSCHKYAECELVRDEVVHPGETCLDRQYMAEAVDTIFNAIKSKEYDDFQGLAAIEMAGAFDILRQMKEAILEDGVVVKSEKHGKHGSIIGYEYMPHPALAHYMKLLEKLNLSPGEFMLTPKEIEKAKRSDEEEKKDNIANHLANTVSKLADKIPGGP